ncbi:DUF2189 domain-containing protein [Thiothrix subterranea]|uniref:DUF2189 domain-containing protein n=1 Tax=Thiothrix subterranea TaxID=2735563 RepID=UPI00192C9F9E|nr:DUF2189 domain-containing protein [Thiothrix subterranea]QQZ29771.1 DUF2189 domain-containing protein [Thiothrix subterranea]
MAQIASKSAGVSSAPHAEQLFKSYPVQHVEPAAIMRWLRQGWADMKANPSASLAYGIVFALVGILMSIVSATNPAFFVAASTGFLLVGPFLALGLYGLSHQIEQGQAPRFWSSLRGIRENAISLGLYAVVLGMMMVFWVRLSAVITGIFFNQMSVDMEGYAGLWNALFTMEQGWMFILAFFGMGLLFALLAFMTGVVTAPMLLERKVDIVTAATTSMRAVFKSPLTMLLWALTITVVIGLGIATFDLGLIIAMPLIAHASWHAYRDTVQEK